MNIPLRWLSEYVQLPKSEKDLTDKLTMVGHMLDKRKESYGDVVIDLELRGNRADMFGFIGVAREVSAIFKTPLLLPKISALPKTDPSCALIKADPTIEYAVKRYIAIKINVTIGPSPTWLTDRLQAYGIDPVNNVVDVTNYVMLETSHPMHAFDFDTVAGGVLLLRYAKIKEQLETIQQGTTLTLTKDDITVGDSKGAQCTTSIGGAKTKVTNETNTIILETAVYDAATSRRSARRHKVFTESGTRHEKHQDPKELPFTMARALELLKEIADAKILSDVSDYYPHPEDEKVIEFYPESVKRLVGLSVPAGEVNSILKSLDFAVSIHKHTWMITVPSFRTDIEQEADIVEEIARIHGYEKIPTKTLSGELPEPATAPAIRMAEFIRDRLVEMQMNEVITASIIGNELVPLYQQSGTFKPWVRVLNAPDPETATLRPSLIPNLVQYAKRSLGFRQSRIALFEIGKVYATLKHSTYEESDTLGLLLTGVVSTTSWNKTTRQVDFYDLKGVVEGLLTHLGVSYQISTDTLHPSLSSELQATILADEKPIGSLGIIHPKITETLAVSQPLFAAELSIQALVSATRVPHQPYAIAPVFPPIIEDLTFTLSESVLFGSFLEQGKEISTLISSIHLVGAYQNNRTVRVTYADPTKTLSSIDIKPLREKLIALAQSRYHANFRDA
jgi:phenylalanyl-tRNA synthetase beta chain